MEVRDAVKAGKTTVLIGTGGVEQNGPYLAGGKHNFVLATVLPEIAKAIGNTLIAPIVKFVPEGAIEPTPRGHMPYPGTISLEPATFEALLTDICRSYKAHGFKDIILVGDSGGNQTRHAERRQGAEQEVERRRTARARALPARVLQRRSVELRLPEVAGHRADRQDGAGRSGQDRRTDTRNGMHDDIYYEAQIAVQDPKLIRAEQRIKAGLFTLHGVDLAPVSKTVELGKKLAVYRAGITARAFKASHPEAAAAAVTPNQFRRIALTMSGAVEGSHMAHPDFRANGRIFATIYPDNERGMVQLTPDQQAAFMRDDPDIFEPASGAWGRRRLDHGPTRPRRRGNARRRDDAGVAEYSRRPPRQRRRRKRSRDGRRADRL